jgi:hypothetical protein
MYVDNDCNDANDGNGGEGNGNGGGDTSSNDAATTSDGNNVNEDNGGNSRTTIGRRRLDDNDGTPTMRWRWVASDMQNACKCCAIHPKQQSTSVDSLGRRRQESRGIWGDRTSEKSRGGID